jgi:RNA polymerase sigma factor (sigma-70 family)
VRVAGITTHEELSGTDARLESIYELHATRVRARCLRLTGDALAAEDLMQEVFARFVARFPQLPASTNLEAYLLATARNIWINNARGARRRPHDELDADRTSDDRLEHDPVRSLLLREQRALVHESARELTGRQRRALAMRELDGRSYAEIGNDLGIGANAVAQVLWRARGQLRRALRRAQVDVERLPAECRALLDDMSDLVDRRASSGQKELEAHIEDCTTCRRTLATYQEAGAGLRGVVPLLPLFAMMGRAATALRASVEASAGIGKVAAVTASVVATVGGGGAIVSHYTASPPAPVTSTRALTETPRPAGGAHVVAHTPAVSHVVHQTDTGILRPSAAHRRTKARWKARPQRRPVRTPARNTVPAVERGPSAAAPVPPEGTRPATAPVTPPARHADSIGPVERAKPPAKTKHPVARSRVEKRRVKKAEPEEAKPQKPKLERPKPEKARPQKELRPERAEPAVKAVEATPPEPPSPPAAPAPGDPVTTASAPPPDEHGKNAEAAPPEPIATAPPTDPPVPAAVPPEASNGGGNGRSGASTKHS